MSEGKEKLRILIVSAGQVYLACLAANAALHFFDGFDMSFTVPAGFLPVAMAGTYFLMLNKMRAKQ